jgi:ATP-dependent DNA helicase RecG
MRLIEKYGSGIGRIVGYFKKEGLPTPEFKNISEGFQVTVFAQPQSAKEMSEKMPEETTQKTTEEMSEKTAQKTIPITIPITIPETTQKLISAIKQNPYISIEELSQMAGITVSGIKWNIKKLKDKGLLERGGTNKGGYWNIKS